MAIFRQTEILNTGVECRWHMKQEIELTLSDLSQRQQRLVCSQ